MQGYQYAKTTGEFIIDVTHWDGKQPQIEVDDPDNPGETIWVDDPAIGITDKKPIPGCYIHVFDGAAQTWREGKLQSEIDAIQAEKAMAQCIAQRRARYREEADPLYLDLVYDARKAGVEPDLAEWVALKDKIKAEIPKP